MNNPGGKADNPGAKIFEEFREWVGKWGRRGMLYRGLASEDWDISCSLLRRLEPEQSKRADFPRDKFMEAVKEVLEKSRIRGHYGAKLTALAEITGESPPDLELLADLQHYDAATCLLDFTRNPLVGLWFACQPVPGDPNKPGRIFALNSHDYENCVKIRSAKANVPVSDLFSDEDRLWIWEPKIQNNRIIAQQSMFVFGKPLLSENRNIPPDFSVTHKPEVLDILTQYGVSEESLYCDFHGFARSRAHEKLYTPLDYKEMAMEAFMYNNPELARYYLDKALILAKEPGQ